ncbi:MAG: fibronectin/fibrinogen-binding protein, partial [Ruminiclostridium sp.]|nr:fibronectin/fibrinogen-binding protein [Ruminiclostridium sp.]
IHGSHVILCTGGADVPDQDLTEAAMLAAWHSQGRESGNVPVDYTPVKYVKKPAGARPGMVIYTTYQTAYVDPDPSLVEKLKKK